MALDDPLATPPGDGADASRSSTDGARFVGDERLPCGRLVSRAWEQARDPAVPADPHMAECPYCQEAVEGLAALDRAVRGLRADQPSARTVADRVMQAVRAEVRLGRLIPLDDPEHELRIAETAAAKVLRRAADSITGVRAASCRLTPPEDGTEVDIVMTLAVVLETPVPDLAAQVRRAVAEAARQRLGVAVGRIDLKIVSALDPVRPAALAGPARDGGEL